MVADGRVEQGPQRDNYLAWGLFQVVTCLGPLHGTPVLLNRTYIRSSMGSFQVEVVPS
jgi:hypothetical protein